MRKPRSSTRSNLSFGKEGVAERIHAALRRKSPTTGRDRFEARHFRVGRRRAGGLGPTPDSSRRCPESCPLRGAGGWAVKTLTWFERVGTPDVVLVVEFPGVVALCGGEEVVRRCRIAVLGVGALERGAVRDRVEEPAYGWKKAGSAEDGRSRLNATRQQMNSRNMRCFSTSVQSIVDDLGVGKRLSAPSQRDADRPRRHPASSGGLTRQDRGLATL